MVAEYSVGTTVSFLVGNSIAAYSISISLFMLGMGLGAFVSQYFADKRELQAFLFVECALSITSAGSTLFIVQAAYLDLAWEATIFVALLIGLLIGFEIPLLSRFNEKRNIVLKHNIAVVFGADYLGSFLAGIAYSMFLLPSLGVVFTPVFSGMINLLIALLLGVFFLRRMPAFWLVGFALFSAGSIAFIWLQGQQIFLTAEQRLYMDPIVYTEQSSYQRIVITKVADGHCLYLDGGTQFCSYDESRYHELLVHPAFYLNQEARKVLILGGGDGLATREVLKYDSVQEITVVDLDPAMTKLARQHPVLTSLNEHSFRDTRVEVINADAFEWLQEDNRLWDIVVVDLPDPRRVELAKLYSSEFYRMARNHLQDDGIMAVQSTSPIHANNVFVMIWHTISQSGLHVVPYRINVPSFGDWGFQLAVRDTYHSTVDIKAKLDEFEELVPLKVLNKQTMQAAIRFEKGIFPEDLSTLQMNRLLDPIIFEAYKKAWRKIP